MARARLEVFKFFLYVTFPVCCAALYANPAAMYSLLDRYKFMSYRKVPLSDGELQALEERSRRGKELLDAANVQLDDVPRGGDKGSEDER